MTLDDLAHVLRPMMASDYNRAVHLDVVRQIGRLFCQESPDVYGVESYNTVNDPVAWDAFARTRYADEYVFAVVGPHTVCRGLTEHELPWATVAWPARWGSTPDRVDLGCGQGSIKLVRHTKTLCLVCDGVFAYESSKPEQPPRCKPCAERFRSFETAAAPIPIVEAETETEKTEAEIHTTSGGPVASESVDYDALVEQITCRRDAMRASSLAATAAAMAAGYAGRRAECAKIRIDLEHRVMTSDRSYPLATERLVSIHRQARSQYLSDMVRKGSRRRQPSRHISGAGERQASDDIDTITQGGVVLVGFIQHALLFHMRQEHPRTVRILAEFGLHLFNESEDGAQIRNLLKVHSMRENRGGAWTKNDLHDTRTWDAFVRLKDVSTLGDDLVKTVVRYQADRLIDHFRLSKLSTAVDIWRLHTIVDNQCNGSRMMELD